MKGFYDEGSTSEIIYRRWFNRFKDGNFSLEDQPRAGRPSELENQRLIELLQEDNRQTTRELAEQLGVDHSTVDRYHDDLGYKYKLGAWVPHDFTEDNKRSRISNTLLSRCNRKSFFPRLITGKRSGSFTQT